MFSYDLALLKLKGTVSFSPFVIPICIPDDINDLVGKNGWITGWGAQYGEYLTFVVYWLEGATLETKGMSSNPMRGNHLR